jgi:hypothetical protein
MRAKRFISILVISACSLNQTASAAESIGPVFPPSQEQILESQYKKLTTDAELVADQFIALTEARLQTENAPYRTAETSIENNVELQEFSSKIRTALNEIDRLTTKGIKDAPSHRAYKNDNLKTPIAYALAVTPLLVFGYMQLMLQIDFNRIAALALEHPTKVLAQQLTDILAARRHLTPFTFSAFIATMLLWRHLPQFFIFTNSTSNEALLKRFFFKRVEKRVENYIALLPSPEQKLLVKESFAEFKEVYAEAVLTKKVQARVCELPLLNPTNLRIHHEDQSAAVSEQAVSEQTSSQEHRLQR